MKRKEIINIITGIDSCFDREYFDRVIPNKEYLNKYEVLSIFGRCNRGSWSSGYDLVEAGLENFKEITGNKPNRLDRAIIKEYDDIISDSEEDDYRDGRYFRDCKYDYETLLKVKNENTTNKIKRENK